MKSFLTIVRKEWAEFKATFLFRSLNLYSGYISVIVLMVICGIYTPMVEGLQWNGSAGMVFIYIALVPFCVTGTIMPSAFVQERQRLTLEHLLASPAPDAALLLGKTVLPCLYGWVSTLICALANLFSLNFFVRQSTFVVYPIQLLLCLISFSLLLSFLFAIVGALTSLRARSYVHAQGRMTAILFGPMFAIAILYGPFSPVIWKVSLNHLLYVISYPNYLILLAAFLILLNIFVTVIGISKFHRNQILSIL